MNAFDAVTSPTPRRGAAVQPSAARGSCLAHLHCAPGEEILRRGTAQSVWFQVLNGQVALSGGIRQEILVGRGEVFGLDGIVHARPSPYSAHAVDRALVAVFGSEASPTASADGGRSLACLRSLLRQQSLWLSGLVDGLAPVGATVSELTIRRLGPGEVLSREGVPCRTFFTLLSTRGGLRLSREGVALGIERSPGAVLGERECLLGQARFATIESIGESVVAEQPGEHLRQTLEERPELAWRLLKETCRHLERATREIGTPACTAPSGETPSEESDASHSALPTAHPRQDEEG